MATLIGNGGHADDIWMTVPVRSICNWRRIPSHEWWESDDLPVIIGINNPTLRAAVADELNIEDLAWAHPSAVLSDTVSFGPGTHINYGVTATRTTIGHHTTISPGVTICGDVTIGDRVLIGAGATICDRVTIDSDTIIGAGSTILPESHLPAGTYVGTPAVRIK